MVDAPLFHGRGRLVAGLVGRLVDTRLLVLSGSSGAGKSSVVRAGVVPALIGGAVAGSEAWRPVIVTPGSSPVDALAELTGDTPPAEPVLLVVDQFEEVWAPGISSAERTAFLDTVLGLLDDDVVARCVVVVRGDHVGRLADHAALAERVGAALVLVPALTDPELREIVREPARSVGLEVEDALVDAVVADGLGRPGALPLLSTALVGTWERRRGDLLGLAGYIEAGGVSGALARSAEAAFSGLGGPGRELARRLLLRLADVDDGGALIRRPVPLAELDLEGAGGGGRAEVVEAFVRRRLLSVDRDRLEVAHEALLTAWPRLARWLDDDAAGRAVRRHLAPTALEWSERGRPDDDLYRGARLTAALEWAADPAADVTPLERSFLDASRARADAELAEAHRRADREAAAGRRARRRAVGLAAALVLALVAAGLAVRAGRETERTALRAEADRLAGLSATVDELDLSLLLAAEGYRLADTDDTRAGLSDTLAEHRRALGVAPISQFAKAPSLGDGGRTLFAVGKQGRSADLARDGPGPPRRGRTARERMGTTQCVRRLPDRCPGGRGGHCAERAMVGGGRRGRIRGPATRRGRGRRIAVRALLHARRTARRSVGLGPSCRGTGALAHGAGRRPGGVHRDTGIAGTVAAHGPLLADVSDDARIAVIWSQDGSGRPTLLNLSSGHQVTLGPPDRPGVVLGYRALSSGAAELWDDGIVTLYGLAGRSVEQLVAQERPDRGAVRDVVLAPDRTWGATVGDGADVRLWRVNPQTGIWTPRESLPGHGGDVGEAEVDAVHRRLITIALGDRVIVWDARLDDGSAAASRATTGGDLLRAACEVAGRDLSRAEWRRYVPGRLWGPTCTDLD